MRHLFGWQRAAVINFLYTDIKQYTISYPQSQLAELRISFSGELPALLMSFHSPSVRASHLLLAALSVPMNVHSFNEGFRMELLFKETNLEWTAVHEF